MFRLAKAYTFYSYFFKDVTFYLEPLSISLYICIKVSWIPHSVKNISNPVSNHSSNLNIIKHHNMAKKRSKPKVKEHGKYSQKQFNEVQQKSSSFFITAAIAILGIILALWTHLKNNDDVVLSLQDLLSMVRRSNSFNLTNSGSRTLLATDDIKSGTILMEISRDLMM